VRYAKAKNVEIRIAKTTDLARISGFGVVSTPRLEIDGKSVYAGGVPSRGAVAPWLDQ